jgi:uncharacterized OB-fold protein
MVYAASSSDAPSALDACAAPFWEALRRDELRLPSCRRCASLVFPIGPCCPECLGDAFDWPRLAGRGQVWSYIVYHHAFSPAFAGKLPYNVAIVRLDEGPQLITNVVGVPPDALYNGMRVRAVFDHTDARRSLLRFEPDPDTPAEGAGATPTT